MKITEIINTTGDMFDVLRNENVVLIDRTYDIVVIVSNDFYIPAGMLNHNATSEAIDAIRLIQQRIKQSSFPVPAKWKAKLDKLVAYYGL